MFVSVVLQGFVISQFVPHFTLIGARNTAVTPRKINTYMIDVNNNYPIQKEQLYSWFCLRCGDQMVSVWTLGF